MSPTNIFAPVSTPAQSIFGLSIFVLLTLAAIFVVVFSLLAYAAVRFRNKQGDDSSEPAQIYGSTQVELAWTVIPVLIVVALFLAATRVILAVQNAPHPPGALEVIVTGHQYWWEYRYPQLNIVTANELHVPVSDPAHPTPTFLTLLSADTDHSFWVPRLGGKTDLIPNHPNQMWIDPHETGLFLGQCAQYCGTQHAKMLLRVYVQSPEEFQRWVHEQQQTRARLRHQPVSACLKRRRASTAIRSQGRRRKASFGPDLTHLMSRDTIAAGAAPNTPERLRLWIQESGRNQTWIENAGHGIERSGPGRSDCLPGDASLMSTNTIALTDFPTTRPLTLRLHEWVTTVDHKRLGILYIFYALIFLVVGGIEATIMRIAAYPAAQRLCFAPGLQSHVHHARHDHDLLRRHADGLRVCELSCAADDRRPRHGVSAP